MVNAKKLSKTKTTKTIVKAIPRKTVWKWIGIILVISLLFRLTMLNTLPPGLHPDEAANGLDIVERVLKGDHRIVYDTNSARESLFFYLQSIPVRIFGNTIFALRLAPAIVGSLAAVFAYLSMRAWFNERIGRISGLLVAILPWSVTLSRMGFRATTMPFFIFGFLWCIRRAYQTGSRKWAAAAGFAMSLGLYTYLSYRIFFAFTALGLAFVFFRYSRWRTQILVTGAVALITALPMFYTWYKHPSYLGARSETSVLKQDNPTKALADSLIKNAGMFVVAGDENPRHNINSWPALNPLLFAAFAFGLILMVKWRSRKLTYMFFMLGFMMIPGIVAAEGAPHYLRQYAAFPFMIALTAVGLDSLARKLTKNWTQARNIVAGVLMITLITTAYGYFGLWAHKQSTKEAFFYESVAVAKEMNKLAESKPDYKMYTYIGGYENITVKYLTWDKASYDHVYPEYTKGDRRFEGSKRIVVDASGGNLANIVGRDNLPKNELKETDSSGKVLYIAYLD